MIDVFKKYRNEILIGLGIVVLFFVLRLPNLLLQPIFADEAIYIRWAQIMKADPTLRFVSLSDGKTPLFMWLMIPMFKVFQDPLLAGRVLSVFSGLATMSGVFVLSWRLFSKKAALLAAFLYAIVPYTVFFDRMALVDSMLAAFIIWSMVVAMFLVKYPRFDLAMILGYLMGGALLVKTPAMMSIIALPITILGFRFKNQKVFRLLILWLVSLVITIGIYSVLKLGPGFEQLSSRNQDYIFSPSDLLANPLDPLVPHIKDATDWFLRLLTPVVLACLVFGVFKVFKEKNMMAISILIWALVPMFILMTILKTFTARYLLLSIPPLLVFAGYGLSSFRPKIAGLQGRGATFAAIILVAIAPLIFDFILLTNPQNAPLPAQERRGYFEDWTAGYGFPEIAQFLVEKKKTNSVIIGTEGYFGTLPEGIQIYLDKSGIPVIGGSATVSGQLRNAAKDNQTYFLGNKARLPEVIENATLIKEYPKAEPRGDHKRDAIQLYQIYPEK